MANVTICDLCGATLPPIQASIIVPDIGAKKNVHISIGAATWDNGRYEKVDCCPSCIEEICGLINNKLGVEK